MDIEGVPNGYEFVKFGPLLKGEPCFWLCSDGTIQKWSGYSDCGGCFAILRKKEKEVKWRPFKNANEYAPNKDRWLTRMGGIDGEWKVFAFSNDGVWSGDGNHYSFKQMLDNGYKFVDDGFPFGILEEAGE